MKDIKIELNANEASGEAYWRKRCDTVEAELARLRAELHRADIALSESPFHGQEELAEASLADGIRNYRSAVEAELIRLRAANAELVEALKKIGEGKTEPKNCPANENLVAQIIFYQKWIRRDQDCAIDAISRAAQAEPEPETCVWTVSENGVWIKHGCTGAQMLKGHMFIRPETCPYCKKKLIIEQAGKTEGRQG